MAISLFAVPDVVFRMIMREMSNGDIFHLSLASKKSKRAVTYYMKKADTLSLCVDKDMVVTMQNEHQCIWFGIKIKNSKTNLSTPVDLENAELFEIQQTSKDGVCKIFENLSPAKLFIQLLYIYRKSEFDFIDIQKNAHLIDIRSVAKAISKVGQLSLQPSSSTMHNQLILNAFPHVECLKIEKPLLLNGDEYHSAFIQNVTRIELGESGRTPVPFNLTLDHLLVSNCLSIKVLDGNFNEEKYNQFFRMWMNGSAPKLEHMHVATVNHEIDQNALLEGLVCHEATIEVYRKNPNKPAYLHQQSITRPKDEGVCIVRKDGIKAIVTVENNELEFFIFHPKCYNNDFDWIL
ncbi:hypothetical protein B9Z55_026271 [Caenorhabditis nigoni]|uniref:Sdz-33 F-box domain-containing protein n=1 Tax=Caenorhabditis nigoni TaxID=1611254 RepID=A0A2G5T2W5_9PELO|nr:hypothetical protein B9Z55_026271 [Caenorhabditis nigoni]